jgi:hypothetical protein
VLCLAIGDFDSKDLLKHHHRFNEIEAVHRSGNHA